MKQTKGNDMMLGKILRKNILILFCAALIFSTFGGLGQVVHAAEADYVWEENVDGDGKPLGTVRITNYIGTDTDLDIPAQLGGMDVTVIAYGERGSFINKGLTNVKIPEGVKEIGQWAFGSNELTSIELPESLEIIGRNAFTGNNLTEVTIPQSVTKITGSFARNEITTVNFSEGIEEIDGEAFHNNRLTSIKIP